MEQNEKRMAGERNDAAAAATALTIRHSRFAALTLAKLVASLALHPPSSATEADCAPHHRLRRSLPSRGSLTRGSLRGKHGRGAEHAKVCCAGVRGAVYGQPGGSWPGTRGCGRIPGAHGARGGDGGGGGLPHLEHAGAGGARTGVCAKAPGAGAAGTPAQPAEASAPADQRELRRRGYSADADL